jgi:putative sterol carrier protein
VNLPTKPDIQKLLDMVRKKCDDPAKRAKLAGFDRTLEFKFTDAAVSFYTRVHDQKMDPFTEGAPDKPNLQVTTDSGTLKGILEGTLSPLDAYSVGKLKAKGSMTDLLKLQVLM